MDVSVIMVTQSIGTPDEIIAAGFENPPDLAQMVIASSGCRCSIIDVLIAQSNRPSEKSN
jgi:hypothetical protein